MKIASALIGAAAALLLLAAGAAQAAAPLETFGKLPTVEMIQLSPNGARVAFVGAINGVRTLTVRELGGPILAATPVGSTKVRDIDWVGNDIVLVSNTSTQNWGYLSGGENMEMLEVVSIDLVGKKSFPVLQKAKTLGAVFGQFGVRQIDGRWYGFYGGVETDKSIDGIVNIRNGLISLFRVNLQTSEISKIADGREDADDWQIGADGKIVAHSTYARGSGVWKLFIGDSLVPTITRNDQFDHSGIVGLGRSVNSLVISPVESEDGVYLEVGMEPGAQPQPLATPPHLSSFWFDRRSHQLIGFSGGADRQEVQMFDPKVQARIRGVAKAFPNYLTTIVSWSDDFGRIIAFTDSGDDPGTYWLVDIATGKATILGARYPIAGKDVGPVRMINYKAADGTAVQGVLTLPPGKADAKNLPLVVLPHGGPASRDEATFDWWAQAFASRGYAVFQPNFRGSTGYGQAFRDAGYGEWGRKMQTDISDGVAKLAVDGLVDPKRACIVGGSYGGYAALAGVTVQQGQYRCAVSYAGISDLGMMLQERELHDPAARYWKAFIGAKTPNDPILKTISPIELADKVAVPVLLIHGKDDSVVPIKQSQVFERELKKQGKPVEMITLSSEDHWLSREETRTAMLKAAVAFVEKNNPPQ